MIEMQSTPSRLSLELQLLDLIPATPYTLQKLFGQTEHVIDGLWMLHEQEAIEVLKVRAFTPFHPSIYCESDVTRPNGH